MSAPAARLRQVWSLRSRREKQMLAIMALSIAAFIVWFGIAAPLRSWSMAAQQRHADALADQAPLQRVLEKLAAQSSALGASTPLAAEDLVRSARELGLSVTLAGDGSERRIHLAFYAVNAESLFAWLEQQRERGVHPQQVDIVSGGEGLNADVVFVVAVP